jgi:Symplekin/PTA1 N-terminal
MQSPFIFLSVPVSQDGVQMASKGEPNLSSCPSHHPFLKIQVLEEEANKLLEESIKALFTTKYAPSLDTPLRGSLTTILPGFPMLYLLWSMHFVHLSSFDPTLPTWL